MSDDGAPAVRWEAHTGRAADGSELIGRLGRIVVPENRSVPDGATIELAFVVYESENPEPGPPIFYLAGGPGGSGVEYGGASVTKPLLNLLEIADVVCLDQRGTGLSVPNLSDAPAFEYSLPLDRPVTRDEVIDAFSLAVEECYDHWTYEEGVDLGAYNTRESADDLDDVRRAIGAEKIVPWGASYGSHLGLAYLRRHPEHAARAVLMKVEGPDDTWKLPSLVQSGLERVHALVAADQEVSKKVPDLMGTIAGLLESLDEEPVTIETMALGNKTSLTIGKLDLQYLVSLALGSSRSIAGLPAALYMMEQGEWSHGMRVFLGARNGDVGSAMQMMMDCASGASKERRARIEKERKDPKNLLSDAINGPYFLDACESCDGADLGDEFRGPLECDVPVLFVSGEIDVRTPPENVEAIRAGFSNHAHVLVTNSGHDSPEEDDERYCALVHAFLRGEAVDDTTIELPPVRFRAIRSPR